MGLALGIGIGLALQPNPGSEAVVFDTTGFDVSSVVTGDLASGEWGRYSGIAAYAPTVTHYDDETDGQCALMNEELNAPTYGALAFPFTVPPGCTSLRLEVEAKAPPGSVGAGAAIAYLFDGSTTISATLDLVLDTDLTTVSTDVTGRTPGETLYVYTNWNATGQTAGLVKRIRVIPLDGSGVFAGTFYRRAFSPHTTRLNAEPNRWDNDRVLNRGGSGSRVELRSNATVFAVEGGPDMGFDADYSVVGVEVNGSPSTTVPFAGYSIEPLALSAGNKPLAFVLAPQYTPDGLTIDATYARAVYVGPCTSLSIPAESTAPRILTYGDSIESGFYADVGRNFEALLYRAGVCRPLVKAHGRRALFFDGPDATARQALVDSMAAVDCDAVWLEVGTNDWAEAYWANAAAFQSAYADLLDKLIAAFPGKTIYAQTMFPRGDITVNANSETIAAYRTAIVNAAAGKTGVQVVDGTTLASLSGFPDLVHPDNAESINIKNNKKAVLEA